MGRGRSKQAHLLWKHPNRGPGDHKGQLVNWSSDQPRGRRPQKDIGKSCHHDMTLMKSALRASQDRLMSSVIVLWSKWPHLSSKQPRGTSTTKDAARPSSSTQFSQNRCLVHSSVGSLGHRSVQVSTTRSKSRKTKYIICTYVFMMILIIVNVICGHHYHVHHHQHDNEQCF